MFKINYIIENKFIENKNEFIENKSKQSSFYITVNEYNIKFKNIINKFVIYSFNSKINENWFIYKYFDNLNLNNVRLFIKR